MIRWVKSQQSDKKERISTFKPGQGLVWYQLRWVQKGDQRASLLRDGLSFWRVDGSSVENSCRKEKKKKISSGEKSSIRAEGRKIYF